MFITARFFPVWLALALACLSWPGPAVAEAVWHCSRSGHVVDQVVGQGTSEASLDSFQLASSNLSNDAVGLSLMDLIDAYSGKTVLLNGRPLTACFMAGESPLSAQALRALGLNWSSMQQMARKSAIVQSHLHLVTDEGAMTSCIAKRFPAVGYLSQPIESDRVVPCF